MKTNKFSNFYIKSAIFGIFSIGAAFLNYLAYPVLTRVLNALEFGEFAVVISISSQILSVLLAFNILSIYTVKNYPDRHTEEILDSIQKVLLWVFLVFGFLVLITSPIITKILKLDNFLSIITILTIIICSVPITVWTGYLQGKRKTAQVGIANFFSSFIKLIAVSLFGILFGLSGSLLGFICASLLSVIIYALLAKTKLPRLTTILKKFDSNQKSALRGMQKQIVFTIVAVLSIGILQNIDIIFTKALFDATEAGRYSSIGLFSNTVYYLGFILIWIILPEIETLKPKHNLRLLRKAALSLCGIIILALTFNILLGKELINLIFGSTFINLQSVLSFSIIYQGSLALITLIIYYLLITSKFKTASLFALATLLTNLFQILLSPESIKILVIRMSISTLLIAILISIIGYRILTESIENEKN
jgi:O-antigen/teichoic acid export membrane protein